MAVSQSLSVTQVSQDVEANTSKIKIVWKSTQSGESHNNYTKTAYYYVSVNGGTETKYSASYTLPKGTTQTIVSKTLTVPHNDTGECSVKVRTYMETGISAGTIEKSKTLTLDKISRASSITSVSDVTLGNSCSVKWTPNSTSFYYKLKFALGDWSKTVSVGKPGTTSAYTYTGYTIPTSVSEYITDGTTATMKVTLYTYSDSSYDTRIGSTSTKSFTVTVPSTTVPNINSYSVTPVNSNSTVDGWGVFLKGYSKAKISCEASGVSGSTIESYVLSGGYATTVTSMPYTGAILTKAGEIEFKCKVKDSRGRASDVSSKKINVIDYSSPSISNIIATRDSGNATQVTVKVSYSFASVDGNNKASAILYYRKTSETVFNEYGTISNNTNVVLDGSFDDTASYVFQVVVTDSVGNTSKDETIISTMKVIMDFRDGGKGLGLGKIAESDNLEVGFESDFFENATFEKDVTVTGALQASNLGRTVYSGTDMIVDKGILSTDGSHTIYFYLLQPFNLVYFRMYIDGLTDEISAGTSKVLLCTISENLKPSGNTALSSYSVKGCDIRIGSDCCLYCMPRNGLGKSADIYISGLYSLNQNSSLYVS